MNRRYKMELRMVMVPVVWKAKTPDRKIYAKRKTPEYRIAIKQNRAKVEELFRAIFGSEDPDVITEQLNAEKKQNEGKIVVFKRYQPLPPIARFRMRIQEDDDET